MIVSDYTILPSLLACLPGNDVIMVQLTCRALYVHGIDPDAPSHFSLDGDISDSSLHRHIQSPRISCGFANQFRSKASMSTFADEPEHHTGFLLALLRLARPLLLSMVCHSSRSWLVVLWWPCWCRRLGSNPLPSPVRLFDDSVLSREASLPCMALHANTAIGLAVPVACSSRRGCRCRATHVVSVPDDAVVDEPHVCIMPRAMISPGHYYLGQMPLLQSRRIHRPPAFYL